MEYLSRLLQSLDKAAGFYYHPKCHRIKLSHIMFADDLILFSSGRNSAILALKEVMTRFLDSSGLSINFLKSQLFIGGMNDAKRAWVEEVIGTKVSPLPVRYLGLPLTSNKLSRKDCGTLIDKLTSRLACWSNRFLSRAGRRVLVLAVLQAMVFFWARVCMLPKRVIQEVNTICANFLWKGFSDKKGGHLISWENVCKDKKDGGLGLKNLEKMNYAMVINQMWGSKTGNKSVWVDWMDKYWTKGKHWWEDEVKADNSWVLKRLIQCKKIGLSCVTITNNAVSWSGHGEGFRVKDTYNTLTDHSNVVEWYKLVWNSFNSPKDSFHTWLAVQNKLMTKDRLSKWGFPGASTCVLCNSGEESRDHLYFACSFAREVWKGAMRFLKVTLFPCRWDLLTPWFKGLPQNRLKTKIIASATTRTMNAIWKARNFKIFRAEALSIGKIVQETVSYLIMKLGAIKLDKCAFEDTCWLIDIGFID